MTIHLQPNIEEVYATGELQRRRARKIDLLHEKQALQQLASLISDAPEEVLPRFVGLALQLTGGVSAGLSLYEPDPAPGVFRWRYLRGLLAPFENTTTPRDFSPCGVTLDEDRPVLSRHPERVYDWIADAHIVVPEVLLVPLRVGADALGTLWIVAERVGHFDRGHARAMTELAAFLSVALRVQRAEQRAQQAFEQQEMLTGEMNHRLKNIFALTDALLRLSAKSSDSKEELVASLSGRLQALAQAHALVRDSLSQIPDAPREADLNGLLRAVIRPYDRTGSSRFDIAGPPIRCMDGAINGIALVFHELATNAAKYGALRGEGGEVSVRWLTKADDLVVAWVERGATPIDPLQIVPGFGARLLQDTVGRELGGRIERDWTSQGLKVTMVLPLSKVQAPH